MPEKLVVEAGGRMAIVSSDGSIQDLGDGPPPFGGLTPLPDPFEYKDGTWMALEESGPVFMSRPEVHAWRMRRSEQLLKSLPQDPEGKVRALNAASALRGIDLQALARGIGERRVAGESLADAFLRLRGGRR